MAEQVGKFLTELPELATPTDDDAMYIVDGSTASKKITMANLKRVLGGNVTGTVEGASVSFSDGADGIPMEECEVTLSCGIQSRIFVTGVCAGHFSGGDFQNAQPNGHKHLHLIV